MYMAFLTLKVPASEWPPLLNMSEESSSSSNRARLEVGRDPDSEEGDDEWKYELKHWLVTAPDRASLKKEEEEDDSSESDYDGDWDNLRMIDRLLVQPSQDSISDETFAALMENAVYCYDSKMIHHVVNLERPRDDYPYSELTESSMPYLKEFLSVIPKNMKSLRLAIYSPEILRTFPDQIGTEGSALEEISIVVGFDAEQHYRETGRQESLSLANMLYVTRNVKDVFLKGFQVLAPSNNTSRPVRAFHSKTKKLGLSNTIICDESPIILNPDTIVSFESIEFFEVYFIPELNTGLEEAGLFWRQWLQASRETLSSIKLERDRGDLFAGMYVETTGQDLQHINTINLHDIETDLFQPLSRLASSRVGSTLTRLELKDILGGGVPPTLAPTLSTFENLEDLVIAPNYHEDLNEFLETYLSLEPPALRNIDLKEINLSDTSFQALFSNKTLQSITLRKCLSFFPAGRPPFSSQLCSLDIRGLMDRYDDRYGDPSDLVGDSEEKYFYDSKHILNLLAVLPFLRVLKIDRVGIVDEEDARRIMDGISSHRNLCCFDSECNTEFNEVLRLPCLRNRFNASEKQLPLGFIPNVIVRSKELCKESGIFQFLKEEYPVYMGS